MSNERQPLSMEQAMERLGFSRAEVYRDVGQGRLNPVKENGKPVFDSAEVDTRAIALADERNGLKNAASEWIRRFGAEPSADAPNDALAAAVVEAILSSSLADGDRDVYLDPTFDGDRVLVRNDGQLEDRGLMPGPLASGIKTTLSAMAGLAEPEERLRSSAIFEHLAGVDRRQIRVTLTRTVLGQQLHLRIFEKEMRTALADAGYSPEQVAAVRAALSGQPGVLLVCSLGERDGDRHRLALAGVWSLTRSLVVSLERRIRYRYDDLVQLNFESNGPVDFGTVWETAAGMNPDALMMDDLLSAEEAWAMVRVANFGASAVVFMSAPSAIDALRRIEAFGIDLRLFGSMLTGIVESRTLSELCPDCRRPADAGRAVLRRAGVEKLWEPVGCDRCHDGFAGTKTYRGLITRTDGLNRQLQGPDWDFNELQLTFDAAKLGLQSLIRAGLVTGDLPASEACRLPGN